MIYYQKLFTFFGLSSTIAFALPQTTPSSTNPGAINVPSPYCYGQELELGVVSKPDEIANTTLQLAWQDSCTDIVRELQYSKHRSETNVYAKEAAIFKKQTPYYINKPGGRAGISCQLRIDLQDGAEEDTLPNEFLFQFADSIDLSCLLLRHPRPSHLGGYFREVGQGGKLIVTMGKYPLPDPAAGGGSLTVV